MESIHFESEALAIARGEQILAAAQAQSLAAGFSGESVAYPNPARGEVTFGWQETGAERARVEIYNLAGERVAALTQTQTGNTLHWNISGLAPGIYFYRVILTVAGAERQLGIRKIAIIR